MVFGPFLDAFSKEDEPGFPIFKTPEFMHSTELWSGMRICAALARQHPWCAALDCQKAQAPRTD